MKSIPKSHSTYCTWKKKNDIWKGHFTPSGLWIVTPRKRSQPFRLSAIKRHTQFRICLRMSGKNCKLTWHHRWPHQFVERLYREQTANMRECSEMSCLNQNMGNCKCLSIYHTNKMPNGNSGKIASTKVGSTWCHWRWLTRWPLQTVMISTWIFLQKNKQYLRGL